MTSYWDRWAGFLDRAEKKGRVSERLWLALNHLIQRLHDYDHTHGGYELVMDLEGSVFLQELLDEIEEESKEVDHGSG